MIPLRCVLAPILGLAAALAACSETSGVSHPTRTIEIAVQGMSCTGCESVIAPAVLAVKGVDACEASFDRARVTVTYQPALTDEAQIAAAIRGAGYEVP